MSVHQWIRRSNKSAFNYSQLFLWSELGGLLQWTSISQKSAITIDYSQFIGSQPITKDISGTTRAGNITWEFDNTYFDSETVKKLCNCTASTVSGQQSLQETGCAFGRYGKCLLSFTDTEDTPCMDFMNFMHVLNGSCRDNKAVKLCWVSSKLERLLQS